MTNSTMNLRALVKKCGDADLLGEMIGFGTENLMELEVGAKTDAGYGEKSSERVVQRSGYRIGDLQTRVDDVERRISHPWNPTFPPFLEPRVALMS